MLGSARRPEHRRQPPEWPACTQQRRTEEGGPGGIFLSRPESPRAIAQCVGFQLADGKMTLAALVDASGYSTAIQQKYQGMLITETKLNIGGSTSGARGIRFWLHRRRQVRRDGCG